MNRQEKIDRLAEFCKLNSRDHDYVRLDYGWVPYHDSENDMTPAWDPFRSADDLRPVMEECRERGVMNDVNDTLWRVYMSSRAPETFNQEYGSWLLLATPEQIADAVLNVIENPSSAEFRRLHNAPEKE